MNTKSNEIRVFFGVPLPERAIQVVNQTLLPLRREFPKIRWVHPELLHITLLFIGSIEEEQLKNHPVWLTDWTEGLVAVSTEIQHSGVFFRGHVPTTFFLSVADSAKLLDEIRLRLEKISFPDRRPKKLFLPHVTLARKRSKKKRHESGFPSRFLGDLRDFCCKIPIDRVNLYRSELTRERPYYVILKQWELTPPSNLNLLE